MASTIITPNTNSTSITIKVTPQESRRIKAMEAAQSYTGTINVAGTGMGRKPFADIDYYRDIIRVDAIVAKAKNEAGKTHKKLTAIEYTEHGIFSASAIKKRFGSFAKTRDHAIENKSTYRGSLSKKAYIKEGVRVVNTHNKGRKKDNITADTLTCELWNDYSTISDRVVRNVFGSWGAFKEAISTELDWAATIK